MMQVNPLLDIHFPAARYEELVDLFKERARKPWCWQSLNTHGKKAKDGSIYFHRDAQKGLPACTICIHRKTDGHLVITGIIPDIGGPHRIEHAEYVKILREFDTDIVVPSVSKVEGVSAMETSIRSLEDYFSREAIRLLELFCSTSNQADRGANLSDQEKWIAFLLCVYRGGEPVDCDTFGKCLKAKNWWLEEGISDLVHEYDFAMRLLGQEHDK
jgi:hypothetical protein